MVALPLGRVHLEADAGRHEDPEVNKKGNGLRKEPTATKVFLVTKSVTWSQYLVTKSYLATNEVTMAMLHMWFLLIL